MSIMYFQLLVPLLWYVCARLFITSKIGIQEMIFGLLLTFGVVALTLELGVQSLATDTEVVNGRVLSKTHRVEKCPSPGRWVDRTNRFCSAKRSREEIVGYRSVCNGYDKNGGCTGYRQEPIYETFYNHKFPEEKRWYIRTTFATHEAPRVGGSMANGFAEPKRWTVTNVNDPASMTRTYDNWIKAVPDSIFNASMNYLYEKSIPTYRDNIHDMYKYNHVYRVGNIGKLDTNKLNFELGKFLGSGAVDPTINVNVVLTDIIADTYRYELETKWVGGNRNDITIVVSMTDGKVNWVDGFTYALTEYNNVFMTTTLQKLQASVTDGTFNESTIVDVLRETISIYDKPPSYEHMKKYAKPPTGAIVASIILNLLLIVGLTFLFIKVEFDPYNTVIEFGKHSYKVFLRKCDETKRAIKRKLKNLKNRRGKKHGRF